MMHLALYDALTRDKKIFRSGSEPLHIYFCGITPYDSTHLGHIATYAAGDVLIRYLRYENFPIRYVQNLTDIDDPILRAARERDVEWRELGREWTLKYIDEMKLLNVCPPDEFPRATEVMESIIELTRELLDAGVAYASGGSVFFRVERWKSFGKLSRLPRDEMLEVANERGNHPDDPRKRDPLDFPLWQAQEPGEPAWQSPWGPGRPGWHVECSTMAGSLLSPPIDIHGGGDDLRFPHHEAEIAQYEAAKGKEPFVRCWFHTGMVRHGGEKMSKSLGNLVMVSDLLERFSPDALRLGLARHHYRESWSFDESELVEAADLARKLQAALERASGASYVEAPWDERYRKAFLEALSDDLDTPAAVEVLSDIADEMLGQEGSRRSGDVLRELAGILGLALGEGPDENVRRGWNAHRSGFELIE